MIIRFFIFFSCFILVASCSWSQSALRAKRHLENDNLERVVKIVERSVRKSPRDPANHFILAQYFTHPDFGYEAVDSANLYIALAKEGWGELADKDRQKYIRKGMDSLSIRKLSLTIDSLAFGKAKVLNTEIDYNHFLESYPKAAQTEETIDLRNEVAYQDAVDRNSPEAMEEFFRSYPEANQAKNARNIYETLYYERFTATGSLESYQKYLAEQPQSTLKEEVALQILKIMSTGADSTLLKNFIQTYPNTYAANSAIHLLNYWNSGNLLSPLKVHYKSGRYYFFDLKKQQLLDFNLEAIDMDSCGWVTSAAISAENKEKWYDRSGNIFLDESVRSIEYLQSGFFKVFYPTQPKASLIHISKDSVLTQIATNFREVDRFFLSKKIGDKWQLISFLGEEILSQPVDSIWAMNDVYFFKNNDRIALAKRASLSKNGKKDFKTLSLLYTDYKFYENGAVWLASNDYQSVLNIDLKPMIPLKKAIISKIALGWLVQKGNELTILTNDFKSQMSLEAQKFKSNNYLIALKNEKKWALINESTAFPEFKYDSVRLFNAWLNYLEMEQKRYLLFNSGVSIQLEEGEVFKILKIYNEAVLNSEDQVRFVEIVNKNGYKKIYNGFGRKIDEGENLKVDALTAKILQLTSNGSKTLVDSAGTKLKIEKVDAFGSMQDGLIPILRNKKFGAYQINSQRIIPFKSDVKLQVFVPDSLFIFQKDGKYGIMDCSGKQIVENYYESITYLNDSLAFVEKENENILINIGTKEQLLEGIKIIEKINFQKQDYFLLRLATGYGIVNSEAQELVPFIFNAIEPIKWNNQLMWKAERRISEMDYQVVAYFNSKGALLFREGFTNEEYFKTSCD